MATSRGQADREAQWAFMARVLAFLGGLALIFNEAVLEPGPRLPLLIVAVGMLGPVVASTVASVVESVRGTPVVDAPPARPEVEGGGPDA